MKNSYDLLKKAGILPKLRLGVKQQKGGVVSTGPHRVKILQDKIIMGIDKETGKEIEMVRYLLEENGEKKVYETKVRDKKGELSYLVQRLAELKEGSEVILEMKRAGLKNYVEVIPVGNVVSAQVEDHDEVEDEELKQE